MNRRLLPSFLALLVMALAVAPAWAQVQNRTIYGIPEGWSVTANGQSVTVSGDSAIVPEGAQVILTPTAAEKPLVSNVTLEKVIRDPHEVPLTLEALNNGTIVVSNPQSGMQYTLNGGAKTAITANPTEITVATGDKVAFYGNGTNITSYEGTQITGGTASVTAYGNIMSLLDEQNFATATTLTGNHNFYQLFQNNLTLTDASGLLLPATALTNSCYNMMFYNCSTLTAAPALPSTTLADKCYQNMFYGCTALTTAPALPATTLAEDCYNSMFQSSGLTAAPALPATTLATRCYNAMFRSCNNLATAPSLPAAVLPEGCYMHMFRQSGLVTVPANMMASATTMGGHCCESMFRECPNLTNAPTIAATTVSDYSLNAMFYHSANVATADFTLPATTLADHCYYNMFNGCTALTTAPALPATTLAESCYQYMFKLCSSLTTAPVLPATTLAEGCYAEMFNGCSNLNSVTCLATSISANQCTNNWLYGVAATGTFITPASTNWSNGASGKPTGWTRIDPYAIPLTMEALTAGNIQVNMGSGTLTTGMKYSVNGGAKNLINNTTTIDVAAGDKVQFFGNGTSTQVYGGIPEVKLLGTAQTKVYGNIMSLLDEDNFATLTALPSQDYVFYGLFKNNATLTDASGLLLPATTLAIDCYYSMFQSCSSLTAAPALPATTLANSCYRQMFQNCSNLNSVTCLATTINASLCTNDWLLNVAATGTFITPASTNWSTGATGIPNGWTRQTP